MLFQRLRQFWKRSRNVILILFLLTSITLSAQLWARPESGVSVSDLPPLSLQGVRRLLIFAPHCDDETLGTGGLILAAQRLGIQVHVVIATNGDGFFFATIRDFRKIYPHPSDYIRLGKLRQQESLSALAMLGVSPTQVDFLSYPDRGTPSMWNDHWSASNPYRSPYSEDSKSPYPLTYDPRSNYSGQDFLADVTSILASFQPDMVVYPHPDDVHPDHWGLNVFVRLAVKLAEHANSSFHPAQYTYLVHRPDYPDIKGLRPLQSLTPPIALYDLSTDWVRIDLTPADIALKAQAVQKYRSQLTLLRGLMDSFIRTDEVFAPVVDVNLPILHSGKAHNPSTWWDVGESPIAPVQLDPSGDFITRSAVPASDLVAIYAARDLQKDLLLCVEARQSTAAEFVYSLRAKILTSSGIISILGRTGRTSHLWLPASRSGRFACLSIDHSAVGDAWAVFIGANVVGAGRIIDEVGWQMLDIPEP